MKIDDFETNLFEDWTWRKKEVSELILIAEEKESQVVLKSIILLLYSHWEGYIKKSCKYYLKYICDNKVEISGLGVNFKAVILKGINKELDRSSDVLTLENELKYIFKYNEIDNLTFDKKVKIDIENEKDKNVINTHDNLNPKIFKNLLNIIGVEYKEAYESKEKYIEKFLLTNRNSIGHGSKTIFNDEEFSLEIKSLQKLRDIIIAIVESFRDELIEFIRQELFLSKNSGSIKGVSDRFNDLLNRTFKEIDEKYRE